MGHNINAQFIHQGFVHASHQRFLQMSKLGIYTGLPKYIPKLSHPCRTCIIPMLSYLSCHINVSTYHLDLGFLFHLEFSIFNKVSIMVYMGE